MTCNWCFQVAVDPKMVAVSVDQGARTHRLIESGGVFSVNLIAHQDRSLVRKFVKPVAEVTEDGQGRAATMAGQEVYEGHSGAPVLRRALAYLDCTVRHHLALGSHSVFVGQVVDAVAHVDETELGQHVLAMGDTKMSYGG